MSAVRGVYEQVRGTFYDAKAMAMVSGGILLANILDRGALVVHADDSSGRQAALALPSALPAAEVTGNPPADVGIQVAYSAGSLGLARRTTSRGEAAAMAVTAQVAACGADAAVERSGWLSQAERAQEDVGFSAVALAWGTKALLDRRAEASDSEKRKYTLGGLAVGGALTVGALLYDKEGGKLDLASHTAGIVVGALGHFFGRFRRELREQTRIEARFAALCSKYPPA